MSGRNRLLLGIALLVATLLSCAQDPTTKLPRVDSEADYSTWETPDTAYTPVPMPTLTPTRKEQ